MWSLSLLTLKYVILFFLLFKLFINAPSQLKARVGKTGKDRPHFENPPIWALVKATPPKHMNVHYLTTATRRFDP